MGVSQIGADAIRVIVIKGSLGDPMFDEAELPIVAQPRRREGSPDFFEEFFHMTYAEISIVVNNQGNLFSRINLNFDTAPWVVRFLNLDPIPDFGYYSLDRDGKIPDKHLLANPSFVIVGAA